jgi:hypothetical protein
VITSWLLSFLVREKQCGARKPEILAIFGEGVEGGWPVAPGEGWPRVWDKLGMGKLGGVGVVGGGRAEGGQLLGRKKSMYVFLGTLGTHQTRETCSQQPATWKVPL